MNNFFPGRKLGPRMAVGRTVGALHDDDDDDDDVYDDISAVMVMWISLRELVPTFKELMCQLGHSFL